MSTSEELKLKSDTNRNIIENQKEKKNKIKEEKTTINEDLVTNKTSPLVNIRQISSLSESAINYFAIGICLFIYGSNGLEWFNINEEKNKQFYLGYFLISGGVLYIFGVINWYEGKELIFLLDFILSFVFFAIFLKNQNHFYDYITNISTGNDKLEGIFYILLFTFLLIIGISSKDKGIAYIIDYATLFISFVFLFAYKFFKNELIGKIDYYMFIVTGALFWITGILKILNNMMDSSIIFFEPSD